MNLIINITCFIFGYIFITSSLYKLLRFEQHYAIVYSYNVVPESTNRLFAWFDSVVELVIGLCLLIGLLLKINLIFAILLLLMYTIAITINLFRGRTNIDCGCGGVVGNGKISKKLVFRNVIMIISIFILWLNFDYKVFSFSFNNQFLFLHSYLILTIIIYLTIKIIYSFKLNIRNIITKGE
ncbi:TPA: MauE/DoxX family redox-associated membrane protein [Bacillus mobilis]|uniref:MauE/DoxX family redox-associated membrane protein n=1 Tax=Bacillus mobilis TaxID=2026190 RepID=UPI0011A26564|nr:DoxX family membrane protein [Bacillus mobilis]